MNTDFLIVGQGIAGTLLSYLLIREGRSVCVIDRQDPDAASRVAGAVINPVAVKNLKPVEGHDKYIPVAVSVYREMEKFLYADFITTLPIFVFDDQALDTTATPLDIISGTADADEVRLSSCFSFKNPPLKINEAWLVNTGSLLHQWNKYLKSRGWFVEQNLHPDEIRIVREGYRWGNIHSRYLVFCEGAHGRLNPFFPGIPFTRNRGDALILEIPGLPETAIYHSTYRLVPKGNRLFWYGSNYQWQYTDLQPDSFWRQKAVQHLNQWLKLPYRIVEHVVAERPTTAGQVPVIKFHPEFPDMVMFNGLGTKGFTNGPALAIELCRQLTETHAL